MSTFVTEKEERKDAPVVVCDYSAKGGNTNNVNSICECENPCFLQHGLTVCICWPEGFCFFKSSIFCPMCCVAELHFNSDVPQNSAVHAHRSVFSHC